MFVSEKKTIKQYTLFIGMKDADTRRTERDVHDIVRHFCDLCKGLKLSYSAQLQAGGYIYQDGEFENEGSLCFVILDEPEEKIRQLAEDMCIWLNQESILITRQEVEGLYLHR